MRIRRWALFYRARLWEMFKQYPRAIAAFEAVLREFPDFVLAARCLAHLQAAMGRLDEAERWFQDALRLGPTDGATHFNLGFVQQSLRQHEAALASMRRAVELKPDIDRAWYGMGLLHATLGRHDQAAEAFQKAAELQPMNPHAWYGLGMAHHLQGHTDKVAEAIARLEQFDPKMTKKLIEDTGGKAP